MKTYIFLILNLITFAFGQNEISLNENYKAVIDSNDHWGIYDLKKKKVIIQPKFDMFFEYGKFWGAFLGPKTYIFNDKFKEMGEFDSTLKNKNFLKLKGKYYHKDFPEMELDSIVDKEYNYFAYKNGVLYAFYKNKFENLGTKRVINDQIYQDTKKNILYIYDYSGESKIELYNTKLIFLDNSFSSGQKSIFKDDTSYFVLFDGIKKRNKMYLNDTLIDFDSIEVNKDYNKIWYKGETYLTSYLTKLNFDSIIHTNKGYIKLFEGKAQSIEIFDNNLKNVTNEISYNKIEKYTFLDYNDFKTKYFLIDNKYFYSPNIDSFIELKNPLIKVSNEDNEYNKAFLLNTINGTKLFWQKKEFEVKNVISFLITKKENMKYLIIQSPTNLEIYNEKGDYISNNDSIKYYDYFQRKYFNVIQNQINYIDNSKDTIKIQNTEGKIYSIIGNFYIQNCDSVFEKCESYIERKVDERIFLEFDYRYIYIMKFKNKWGVYYVKDESWVFKPQMDSILNFYHYDFLVLINNKIKIFNVLNQTFSNFQLNSNLRVSDFKKYENTIEIIVNNFKLTNYKKHFSITW